MPRDQIEQAVKDASTWASVIELRNSAEELADLCSKPKPLALPRDQTRRERLLLMRLRAERRRSAKLVELLAQ